MGATILAVRHGPIDAEGICYGQLDLISTLSDAEVAQHAKEALLSAGWGRPAHIWSSDLRRCTGPAGVLAQRLGVVHAPDERLREMNYGAWEGKAWDDIDQRSLDEWMEDWQNRSPPGGETLLDLETRVREWWVELPPGRHLLLAHAGIMHTLAVVADLRTWGETMESRIPYLGVRRFGASAG